MKYNPYRFCVAPMMDGTDRHCRYFHRILSKQARLYSEMLTSEAIIHGSRERLLGFDACEHPVALQLGGSQPSLLAEASRIGEDWGYDEINLNVGCPSDRVQSGAFGACLMKSPSLVGECVSAMKDAVRVPVTVKCRIGVDDQDPEESLFDFVRIVEAAGCDVFIIHARKAWLQGLSPKENREIPPLDYEIVHRLKSEHPDLTIVLNGGLASLEAARVHLEKVDGVMLGRAAYHEPYILADVDRIFFNGAPGPSREDAVRAMIPYVHRMYEAGVTPHQVTRHMIGLFHGRPRARLWRRRLSEQGASAGPNLLAETIEEVAGVLLEG